MKLSILVFAFVFTLCQSGKAQNTKTLFFDDLPLQTYSEGIRPVSTKSNYWKNTIKIKGVPFSRGFGAQSPAVLSFMLDGNAKKFSAEVGVDDSSNTAIPLTFYVLADQRILFQSKPMNVGDPAVKIDVDLTGVTQLGLLITDTVGGLGNKRTNGNWANARLIINEGFTPGYIPNTDPQIILTPATKIRHKSILPRFLVPVPAILFYSRWQQLASGRYNSVQ
jgi:alpha-galactosidase